MGETSRRQTVALVGAGRWGKNLARNLYTLGALHTLCDSNEGLLDHFESLYPGIQVSCNYSAVLKNPEISAIAIAAPAAMHYQLAKQALEAGKDIYVEKPLCLDCRESEELIHLADSKGLVLMVGHLLQYHPCVRYLQEIIARGELGKLQYIVSNRLNLGHFRTEENALWNFAPHDISVILSLCGSQLPKQVSCSGAAYLSEGVADISLTSLTFEGDLRAHIYVSWLNPFKEQKLTVIGSSGMAVFDDTKAWDEKLLLYRNHVTWSEGMIPTANPVDGERVEIPQREPLKDECEHFLDCCERRSTPRTDGIEGLRVLRVLQAAQASLDEEGTAKDPSVGDLHSLDAPSRYFSHPSAVIDSGACIKDGVKIWHFSHIMTGAEVGPRCNIGQNVVISPGVVLGTNVKVQNNVSIYSGVVVEDDVFIGPSAVFTNVKNPRSAVPRRDQYIHTQVHKGATVGANSTIVCGVDLGAHCFIGAGAVVTRSVKRYALIVGNPGRQIGWMSRYGERLDLPVRVPEDEPAQAICPHTGDVYELRGEILRCISQESAKTPQDESLLVTSPSKE